MQNKISSITVGCGNKIVEITKKSDGWLALYYKIVKKPVGENCYSYVHELQKSKSYKSMKGAQNNAIKWIKALSQPA